MQMATIGKTEDFADFIRVDCQGGIDRVTDSLKKELKLDDDEYRSSEDEDLMQEEPEDEAEELQGSEWDPWFTEAFGEDDLQLIDGEEFRELSRKLSKATRRIKEDGDKYETRADRMVD